MADLANEEETFEGTFRKYWKIIIPITTLLVILAIIGIFWVSKNMVIGMLDDNQTISCDSCEEKVCFCTVNATKKQCIENVESENNEG